MKKTKGPARKFKANAPRRPLGRPVRDRHANAKADLWHPWKGAVNGVEKK